MKDRKNYLNHLSKLAMDGIGSADILSRAGSFLLYSNLAEFLILQGGKLCADVTIRSIRAWGIDTPDVPDENELFSMKGTRKALRFSRLLLDGTALNLDFKNRLEMFINTADTFLSKRNLVTHNLCHPDKVNILGLTHALSEAEAAYKLLVGSQRELTRYVINGGNIGEAVANPNKEQPNQ